MTGGAGWGGRGGGGARDGQAGGGSDGIWGPADRRSPSGCLQDRGGVRATPRRKSRRSLRCPPMKGRRPPAHCAPVEKDAKACLTQPKCSSGAAGPRSAPMAASSARSRRSTSTPRPSGPSGRWSTPACSAASPRSCRSRRDAATATRSGPVQQGAGQGRPADRGRRRALPARRGGAVLALRARLRRVALRQRAAGGRHDRRPATDRERAVGRDVSGPETDDAMTRSEEELRVGTTSASPGRARLRSTSSPRT